VLKPLGRVVLPGWVYPKIRITVILPKTDFWGHHFGDTVAKVVQSAFASRAEVRIVLLNIRYSTRTPTIDKV